jgi:hypothetical protein
MVTQLAPNKWGQNKCKGRDTKIPNYMRPIYEEKTAFIENKYELKKQNGIPNS